MRIEWICLTFGLLSILVGMAIMDLQKRRRHINVILRTAFVLLLSGYVISLLSMVLEDLI
jgi:uncharacterized membrane protein YozB (DUF420 family)